MPPNDPKEKVEAVADRTIFIVFVKALAEDPGQRSAGEE